MKGSLDLQIPSQIHQEHHIRQREMKNLVVVEEATRLEMVAIADLDPQLQEGRDNFTIPIPILRVILPLPRDPRLEQK